VTWRRWLGLLMMVATLGLAVPAHLTFAAQEPPYVLALSEAAIFIEGLILFATERD
jgi:hypothetical protein